MRKLFMAVVQILVLAGGSRMSAADDSLERLLRAQAFNREFEGFDSYYVRIEADQPQPDGSHEVLAVEDSRTGITSAVAAGLQCAAIGFDSGAGYVGVTRLCDLVGIALAN